MVKSETAEKVFFVEVKNRELPLRFITLLKKWFKFILIKDWEDPPLWKDPFRWPVEGKLTYRFGAKRLIHLSSPRARSLYLLM